MVCVFRCRHAHVLWLTTIAGQLTMFSLKALGLLKYMSTYTLPPSLAAALILAVGMGFGRFAFTGLYPMMVADGALTLSAGSFVASANYLGYLLGALLVRSSSAKLAPMLCRISMLGTVICLAAMAIDASLWLAISVRLLAGVISAVAMVAASAWLLRIIGETHGAPILYSGVGLGIFFSAELIAAGKLAGYSSTRIWLVLAAAAVILSCMAWRTLHLYRESHSPLGISSQVLAGDDAMPAGQLVVIYGLAGFGYIITATYLPLFASSTLFSIDPMHLWAAFGVCAASSCLLWHSLHMRLGTRRSLALNLGLQAVGVALPALSQAPLAYLGCAVLVGGTFMGTVTIAMPAARQVAAQVRFNMLAVMTAAYGAGQITGPLISSVMSGRSGSFTPALLAATTALCVATAISIFGVSSIVRARAA